MSCIRCILAVLCMAAAQLSFGQQDLRRDIDVLERMPERSRVNWAARIDALLLRSPAGSPEALDLYFLLASDHAQKLDFKSLLAMEDRWAPWRSSLDKSKRTSGEAAAALAWKHYYLVSGQPAHAAAELQRFDAETLMALPAKWQYRVLASQADLHEQLKDERATLQSREAAMAVARRMGDAQRLAWALARQASALSGRKGADGALAIAREAHELIVGQADEIELQLFVQNTLGMITADVDPEASRAIYLKMAEMAKAHGESSFEVIALSNLADTYLQRREFAQALQVAERAARIRIPANDSASTVARHNLGIAKIGLGRLMEGKYEVLQAISRDLAQGDLSSASASWHELAQFLGEAGDYPSALDAHAEARLLEEQLDRARETQRQRPISRSLGLRAESPLSMAQSERTNRHALVIGNQDYREAPLLNPVSDARAMARLFSAHGFQVSLVENLKRDDIGSVLDRFVQSIRPGEDVVFFYAGHGLQVRGINYLPAVDARLRSEGDAALNSINLNLLAERLDDQQAGARILLIDACRDNPFGQSWRSRSRGLGRMPAVPAGTLAHFATRPGSVASDGTGPHGLYTSELLRGLGARSEPIELALKEVSAAVRRASKGEQEPWSEGAIEQTFVLTHHPGIKQVSAR
ncbi:caspase family protein [Inhella sp.]|uniref:caspase family protein n=1 Tax=Inhella sp. TaxID=1921806 RepID=UPI0035B1B67E